MGCKGSKHRSATRDAISPQKRSELPKIKTSADAAPAAPAAVEVVAPPVNGPESVKDITENIEGKKEEEEAVVVAETGKSIVSGSPDRYFSSRKEDDGTESANGGEGCEYFSPTNESEQGRLSSEGGKDGALEVAAEEKEADKAEGGEGDDVIAPKDDAGLAPVEKASIVEIVDMKVNVLVAEEGIKVAAPAVEEEATKDGLQVEAKVG